MSLGTTLDWNTYSSNGVTSFHHNKKAATTWSNIDDATIPAKITGTCAGALTLGYDSGTATGTQTVTLRSASGAGPIFTDASATL